MKQRIVIDVPMNEENRKKAMKLASQMRGVSRVEAVRDRNHLVVVGDDIDSVKLVNSLRKKFCFANIVALHSATATASATAELHELEMERRIGEDERWPARIQYGYPAQHYGQPGYYVADPFYEPNPPTPCSIM